MGNDGFRKSTFSGSTGNCVEVNDSQAGVVQVRDSKNPDGAVLRFTGSEWEAFVKGVQDGQFDPKL